MPACLLGDAAPGSELRGPEGEAEQRPLEGAARVAAKGLVGLKLVWVVALGRRGHKIDALAGVDGADAGQMLTVWVEYGQLGTCMQGAGTVSEACMRGMQEI